jgi:glycosyltransferase involved in cell wall biosynthesis
VGEFVEAASLLEGKGVRFVLVGAPDPNNPNSISEDRLQTWENRENIEWWGFREDMPNVLGQACVVCLPSYREGLPKVLLEAASCGRPIVTTDVPGCREIVQHGKNGLLVPPKDPNALAQAICQLIQDPELRERMGDQGRKLVLENFSLEKVKQQTSKVYQVLEN